MGHLCDTDRHIARLATAHHGVVSRRMLLDAGLTAKQIRHRREAGRLIEIQPRVYAVGHVALAPAGRRLAAAWTYGPDAVLSHRTAAAVWDLRGAGGRIDVSVPTTAGLRERPGTRLHRTGRTLEAVRLGVLPVTTVARTVLDLAAVVSSGQLESVLSAAEQRDRFDLRALTEVLDAHPRHRGARALRAALQAARHHGLALTLSELEIRLRDLCRRHGLPAPVSNPVIAGRRRDFHWPGTDLVVETDGWASHRTRAAFEADRARDRELVLAGYRVVRFTHRQIVDDPAGTAATLRGLLALSPSRP